MLYIFLTAAACITLAFLKPPRNDTDGPMAEVIQFPGDYQGDPGDECDRPCCTGPEAA